MRGAHFSKSREFTYRRLMRDYVRKGPFTKAERDVTLAILNVWLTHRNGPKTYIHPSRYALAKKAGVSVRTVASVLSILRTGGALVVISNTKGGRNTATRYRIDDLCLLEMCGLDLSQIAAASRPLFMGENRAILHGKNGQKTVQNLHTVKEYAKTYLSQSDLTNCNVIQMPVERASK